MLADFPGNPIYFLLGLPLAVAVWVGLPTLAVFFIWRSIGKSRSRRRFLRISEALTRDIASFPECSWGAHRVTLILKSGQKVREVIVSSGAIWASTGLLMPTSGNFSTPFRGNNFAQYSSSV
jgi:hypothetical protein